MYFIAATTVCATLFHYTNNLLILSREIIIFMREKATYIITMHLLYIIVYYTQFYDMTMYK